MVGYAMNGIDPPFHVIIGYGNSYFFFVYIHFKISRGLMVCETENTM